MADDFEFIPPAEILSITTDPFWEEYHRVVDKKRHFVVKHKCPEGLIYVTQTWARDELEAYQQVMTGKTDAIGKE